MIGDSNSNVVEGSGLLVYDALSFDEWFPMFWKRTVVFFFFKVKQSKKDPWAASS
jgi:hypothetical protein